MVGLDILGHVVRNMIGVGLTPSPANPDETALEIPNFFQQMLDRKLLGDKTGGGFYKKSVRRAPSPANLSSANSGEDERLALDWKTLEYRPRQKPRFASLDMAKNIDDPAQRIRTLLGGSGKTKDEQFLWNALSDLWNYSANRIPEISDDIVEIDRAMRMGFKWGLVSFGL